MIMLDYKGGQGGGGGVKNLGKSDYKILTMWFVNFYQINLYFFYLKFFDFTWYFSWVSFKLQVYYNKDHCTVNVQSLLSNTYDFFSRIFEVFNEMEMMEINVINNKNFTKFYLKTRLRGKEIS